MHNVSVVQFIFTVHPLNFRQPSSWPDFKFHKWFKYAENHKTNNFYLIF